MENTEIQEAEVISEEKGVKKPLSIVKLEVGIVVPDEFKINGVMVSEKKIQDEIDKLQKMEIKGVHDKKGIKNVEDAKKSIAKLRTTSNTWRADTARPINNALTEFKAKIDKFGVLCASGEKIADEKLQPILDEQKRLEEEAEAERNKIFTERITFVTSHGGASSDALSYLFAHDPNLFYNAEQLKAFEKEEWGVVSEKIKASWAVEQNRLDLIAKEAQKKEQQLSQLNEKAINLRKKELTLFGFTANASGDFLNSAGTLMVSNHNLLTVEDEKWDEVMAKVTGEEVETISFEQVIPGVQQPVTTPSFSVPAFGAFSSAAPKSEVKNDFASTSTIPAVTDKDQSVLTRSIVFSNAKPYIEFAVGTKFVQRIFPIEYAQAANVVADGYSINYRGQVNELLSYVLVQLPQA